MVLTPEQIVEKIKNPNSIIDALKKEHKKLLMHVHGVDVTEYLTQIEGLENSTKIAIRKRLARSNKDLFADILRPTDKIFTSDGGLKDYDISSEKTKEEFKTKLSDIIDGYSLTEWLETYFVDKYTVDPNGLFFIEHSNGEAYPTYKAISCIRDYEQKGRGIEYIIFEPEQVYENGKLQYETIRVYDDAGDRTYKLKGDSITKIDDESYPNPWGYVPAVTCSDLTNTLTGYKKSSIYEQVELADEYLRETSVKTLFKYHHGFPLFWQYMSTCPVCKGIGSVNKTNSEGENITCTCNACNGSGWAIKKDVSDVTGIMPPESNETPTITPEIAGYVVPPIESWRQMTEELKLMRDMIFFSHWGTMLNREDNEKTAFEVSANIQPIQDRLNKYTSSLESTETYIVDMLGAFYYNSTYKGSSINYGRNYIIKSPGEVLEHYLKNKTGGASYTILNDKLKQYYHTLYAHDKYSLSISMKLIQVEPFIHNTIDEVAKWSVPAQDFAEKRYYNDWLSNYTKEELLKKDVKQLKSELTDFVKTKIDEQTIKVQGIQGTEIPRGQAEGQNTN